MKKLKKNQMSGITLIALVVTIIVLLLLAGISIQMLTGDNGILKRATDAKVNSDEAQIKERIQLAYHSALTKDLTGENGQLTSTTLQEELDSEFKDKTATITPNGDKTQWIITVDNVDVSIPAGKTVIDKTKDKNGVKIASTLETTPWLPTEDTEITNNDLNTGLTIKDGNDNEWVWIEVPKSKTANATTDAEIKTALENYVYVENAKNETSPLLTKVTGFTDVNHDGTGITDTQYAKKYSAMLKSIKANGGFYIGKYEVGYEDTNFRNDSNKANTANIPVIRADAFPYNFVTNEQAESLSEILTDEMASTEDGKAGLMFGIQWDLVLRHLNVKGGLSVADLTSKDSTVGSNNWGNYYQNNLNVTSVNAKEYPMSTWSTVVNGKKTQGPPSLLTTGSSTEVEKMNIYDLAGNVYENTLEKHHTEGVDVCSYRGGNFAVNGSTYPASRRDITSPKTSSAFGGFRPTLY